ncbi:nucleoside-diphosphate kinase [Candidatus Dependentiae bacterium]|nr:nucleoside-diphosphate kinase [Candidatus Dependentiae bacterium]
MVEKTFAIIKPDAVAQGLTGQILSVIELNKFTISRMEKIHATKEQAEEFYGVHKERPFFQELVASVTHGPIIVMVLEKENAIVDWRELMGATDPQKARVGTIRKMFGASITANATHGSDAPETAQVEIAFFFPQMHVR